MILSNVVDAAHIFVRQPTHPTYPSLSRLEQFMNATYSVDTPPVLSPHRMFLSILFIYSDTEFTSPFNLIDVTNILSFYILLTRHLKLDSAGDICAVNMCNAWYRAMVVSLLDDMEVEVKFVDYGGYARAPISSLRQIRYDFMTLPFQATECYLANVKPTDGKLNHLVLILDQLIDCSIQFNP